MNTHNIRTLLVGAALFATALPPAFASCGASFCTLMTDRFAQGSADAQQGWSADLRFEQVTQKQLRRGTTNLDASEVADAEAIERRTRNQNLVTTLSYGFDADWSVQLRVPVVRRDHRHDLIDEDSGAIAGPEQWRFTRLGDVQLIARRHAMAADASSAWALFGGLKLPTGSIDVMNADGSRAERSLQPGSGTTDAVIGASGRLTIGFEDALIGQVGVTKALNSREQFKPGTRVDVSAGWARRLSPMFGGVLQLNLRHRGHDAGAQAEPDDSGSTTLDLSPGITVAAGHASTFYAYLQLPIYQKVTGIQLVPRNAFVVGWTGDF
jgi:hypothetical protein